MNRRKSSRCWALLILAVVLVTWCWLQLSRPRSVMARISFPSGVEIIVYEDNFWELSCPVTYEIQRNGQTLVPLTHLTSYLDQRPGDFKSAMTTDASLYAAWPNSSSKSDDVPIIVFHLPTGESWPRLRDDEVSYTSSVQIKWRDRLAQLKRECPMLPEVKLD